MRRTAPRRHGPSRPWPRSPRSPWSGPARPGNARSRRRRRSRRPSGTSRSSAATASVRSRASAWSSASTTPARTPAPRGIATKLVDEMRKAGVENPNKMLKAQAFSLVIVRARIPDGTSICRPARRRGRAAPGQRHDEPGRRLPVETRLREMLIAGGTPKAEQRAGHGAGAGHDRHRGQAEQPQGRPRPRRRRIKKETPFQLLINENRRSVKTATLLRDGRQPAVPLSARGSTRTGWPTPRPTSSSSPEGPPRLPPQPGPLLPGRQAAADRRQPRAPARAAGDWGKDLLDPKTAGVAALRARRAGRRPSIDTLKTGLASPNAQVRFFAAEALAYLNDASGVDVLAETAIQQPEFRAYALAALAATDQAAAHMTLRKLMDVADVEVRYGAFNALRTLDPNDPFLGRVRVLDDPPEPEEDEQERFDGAGPRRRTATAQAAPRTRSPSTSSIATAPRWSTSPAPGGARSSSSAADQKLLTPVVLGTGATSCSTPPTATRRSRSARSSPASSATAIRRSPGVAGTRRRDPPGGQPRGEVSRHRRRSCRPPRARRTCPARWSSTPFPAPVPSTSRPRSSARTRLPRKTTPSSRTTLEAPKTKQILRSPLPLGRSLKRPSEGQPEVCALKNLPCHSLSIHPSHFAPNLPDFAGLARKVEASPDPS